MLSLPNHSSLHIRRYTFKNVARSGMHRVFLENLSSDVKRHDLYRFIGNVDDKLDIVVFVDENGDRIAEISVSDSDRQDEIVEIFDGTTLNGRIIRASKGLGNGANGPRLHEIPTTVDIDLLEAEGSDFSEDESRKKSTVSYKVESVFVGGSKQKRSEKSMIKVIVANIPGSVEEEELRRIIGEYADNVKIEFGQRQIDMLGEAVVELQCKEDETVVIKRLNETVLHGSILRCEKQPNPGSGSQNDRNTVIVCGIPGGINEMMIRGLVGVWADVEKVHFSSECQGTVHVILKTSDDVKSVVVGLNGQRIGKGVVKCRPMVCICRQPLPKGPKYTEKSEEMYARTICVKNVPKGKGENDVRDVFQKYASVEKVSGGRVIGKVRTAFVILESVDIVADVIKSVNEAKYRFPDVNGPCLICELYSPIRSESGAKRGLDINKFNKRVTMKGNMEEVKGVSRLEKITLSRRAGNSRNGRRRVGDTNDRGERTVVVLNFPKEIQKMEVTGYINRFVGILEDVELIEEYNGMGRLQIVMRDLHAADTVRILDGAFMYDRLVKCIAYNDFQRTGGHGDVVSVPATLPELDGNVSVTYVEATDDRIKKSKITLPGTATISQVVHNLTGNVSLWTLYICDKDGFVSKMIKNDLTVRKAGIENQYICVQPQNSRFGRKDTTRGYRALH